MQRLAFAAESAKIALSSKEETRVRIPCVVQRDGQFFDLDETLTRSQLEDLVAPLIERSVGACEDVLARAGLKAEQVDELVLVGGQTRMPAIRRRLTNFKRFSEEREVHPELGVCIGAAILGRQPQPRHGGAHRRHAHVHQRDDAGGVTFEAIPPNTPVPSRRKIIIEGLPPWQAPIPLAIFEAVDSAAIDREVFGTVMIGPEFRVKGAPTLHLDLAPDFKLKAKLSASGGPETVVPIVEVKAAR
jgi:molecular chaperone DnaK